MNSDNMIVVTIDNRTVAVPAGTTILNACKSAGIKIPTLCHLEEVSSNASCGICVVEVEGAKSLVRSCVQTVASGMKIHTATARVMRARKTVTELILANHPFECPTCLRSESCELQALAAQMGITEQHFPQTKKTGSDRLHRLGRHAGQQQMHTLRPMRRGVPRSSVGRRH